MDHIVADHSIECVERAMRYLQSHQEQVNN